MVELAEDRTGSDWAELAGRLYRIGRHKTGTKLEVANKR